MQVKLNPLGKINFPGFQEILDFTSAGSEASVSVTVDGDTDKEYRIVVSNVGSQNLWLRLNNDSTADIYGRQYIYNNAGTITAARGTLNYLFISYNSGYGEASLLTPSGLIKTMYKTTHLYSSGTTVGGTIIDGFSYNSTSNITSLDFLMASGNFTSGTRITVYARRSNV
jgi:hypothetical protein